MSVSLYVMPLRTYLTGRFRTTWQIRREGLDGFYMTSEGAVAGPPPRKAFSLEQAETYVERLRAALGGADWDEDAEALSATAMSQGALASVADLAVRGAFPMLRDLVQPFWLPVDFDAPRELPDPAGGEEPITVLSSTALRRELDAALALLEADGDPADGRAAARLQAARHVRDVAALSQARRVPVVVEG